eukprot:TRINITY_DN2980_c0_g1_i7.p1 TRINITY_DN2980_c0_g1~~TRINITY_DN2980_c0_g1_i7.p1  ORF type:complete len:278 (+),score=-8.38 TRINITY_DN2980_c0_g1_i7:375-1208(+)
MNRKKRGEGQQSQRFWGNINPPHLQRFVNEKDAIKLRNKLNKKITRIRANKPAFSYFKKDEKLTRIRDNKPTFSQLKKKRKIYRKKRAGVGVNIKPNYQTLLVCIEQRGKSKIRMPLLTLKFTIYIVLTTHSMKQSLPGKSYNYVQNLICNLKPQQPLRTQFQNHYIHLVEVNHQLFHNFQRSTVNLTISFNNISFQIHLNVNSNLIFQEKKVLMQLSTKCMHTTSTRPEFQIHKKQFFLNPHSPSQNYLHIIQLTLLGTLDRELFHLKSDTQKMNI